MYKSKKKRLDNLQNKYFIMYTFVFSIIFAMLFVFVKEKTKFNFVKGIYEESINSVNEYKSKLFLPGPNNLTTSHSNKIEPANILAKSYIVYDLTNKKLILGKEEEELFPLASVSKLMTAYVALNYCNDKLKNELDKVLIASDNKSANLIADNCPNYDEFVKNMNYTAKKNDLKMSFVNPSGLDINNETEASNYGNAISVARLISLVYEKNSSTLNHTTTSTYAGIENTNHKVSNMPFLIGSKTGFTDVAGGNLATIYEVGPELRFAIVVLGSTKEGRFTDTQTLLKEYLRRQ